MKTVRGKCTLVVFFAGLLMASVSLVAWYIAGRSPTGLLAGAIAGVIIITVLVYIFSAIYGRTLNEYLEWSAGMAEGKFDHEFKFKRNEEDMTRLFENVLKMNKGVGKYTLDIQKQAQLLADAVQKIFSSAEQISTGSHDQANQVKNMLLSIEKLAAISDDSAKKAEKAADVARNSMDTATIGAQAIQKVGHGMELIDKRIEELRVLSTKIRQFVEVIDGIAGQTNLLALNAAIEAARAGEHGQGFAVVAGEVRELAETSEKATKEITELINGIGEATGAATCAVKQGVSLTSEAGKQFQEITGSIQNTLNAMLQIANESRREVEATGAMVKVAEAITNVTQEAAASTEEAAVSAQELATIADRLKQDADLVKKSFQSNLK